MMKFRKELDKFKAIINIIIIIIYSQDYLHFMPNLFCSWWRVIIQIFPLKHMNVLIQSLN